MQRIVCAANLIDGVIILGARHFDTLMHAAIERAGLKDWKECEQGFINQQGRFLTRTEAWIVASAAGQIIHRCGGDTANGGTLYSENLY